MPEEQNEQQNADIGELRERLEACETTKNELIEFSKRIKADFVNYKKDQEKAVALTRQYANEVLLEMLLPILDSFELALEHMPKEIESDQWAQGVKSMKSQIDGVLKNIGVTDIPAVGEKFDPRLHEAIAETESEKDDGIITAELQKGYKLYDKVLRPAKVKISIKKINN